MRLTNTTLIGVITAIALISTLYSTATNAQDEELWDLMGFWTVPGPFADTSAIYELVVTPRNELRLTLRETTGGLTTGDRKYLLSVNGRDLSGTVTWSMYYEATSNWNACNVPSRTFAVRGRLAADLNTFVLTWVMAAFDVYSCSWTEGEPNENIMRFSRYR